MDKICSEANFNSLTGIFKEFTCILARTVLPFLVTLAVAGFVWGVIKYFLNPDNEEKRKEGKTFMIWGIIALFVMVSIWGLVGIFSETFHLDVVMPGLPE